MKRKAELTFAKKSILKNDHKGLLIAFLCMFIFGALVLYEYSSYKILFKNFSSTFDENNFSNANNLLLSKEQLNPFKALLLKDDLCIYFNSKIECISSQLSDGTINEQSALKLIDEIKRYDIDISIPDELTPADSYEAAVNFFNSKDFIKAYDYFSNVKSTDSNYASSVEYTKKCKNYIKDDVVQKATKLCTSSKYDKALELLDSVNDIVGDEDDIVSKVEEVKKYYSDSITSEESTQVTSSLNHITTSTINNLSLDSTTSFFMQVDLANQKTNIYQGKRHNWNLIKTFTCSSGIEGDKTPTGVYTIKEKGDWFFSDKYQEGAKYWVQFYGDYLFHSLPYASDKETIVDYTLGTPASHGCIRLAESDSKWIYDNIPKGTKVIIQ